jgi:ribonuclease HII
MIAETKKMKSTNYVIGIDEVGRGALAGPVVVAAAMMYQVSCIKCQDGTLKDSKKLSAKQREVWCEHFRDHPGIAVAVARVYPRGIEKMNISHAANLAASRAYRKLIANCKWRMAKTKIFLDGGLYLGNRKRRVVRGSGSYSEKVSVDLRTHLRVSAFTMVRADEKIPAVAIASIVAKVHRDAAMRRLAKKYPHYGFEIHKGYGTKAHYAALKKSGASPAHRLTFLKKQPIIGK